VEDDDNEGKFQHPMLKLAAIYRAEHEFVRRWLEEEEQKRRERNVGFSKWLNDIGRKGVWE